MSKASCLVVAFLLLPTVAAEDLPVVALLLDDGRIVTGQLDARTDHEAIWLRESSEHVVVASRFPRDQVESCWISTSSESQELPPPQSEPAPVSARHEPSLAIPSVAAPTVPPPVKSRDVKSLQFTAKIANWDRDAEVDGICVEVAAFDDLGDLIPLDGAAYATLTTWSRTVNRRKPRELEYWTRRISSNRQPTTVSFCLPFKELRSAYDRRILGEANLEIRFDLKRLGTFRARKLVRLHEINPVTDQILLRQGNVDGDVRTFRVDRQRLSLPRYAPQIIQFGW